MTRIARIIAAASLSLMFATTALASSAAAQTQLFEVEKSDATKLLQVGDDAGFVVRGTLGAGGIPAAGSGVRLMWYPGKSAFRAGRVDAAQWDDGNIGQWSAAFGQNTTASGTHSLAAGGDAEATADRSVAMGGGTTASGQFSLAMGQVSVASGFASTAIGERATASNRAATALGGSTTASGMNSTAMGVRTIASGDASTAMGFETQASGVSSTAMGAVSTAAGIGSVAMGTRAVAQGAGSFVFADRSSTTESVTAFDNQFVVRAHGGIGFNSGTNIGCDLPAGVGAWACTSSRLAKEGFEDMDGEAVLAKLASIPIQRWSYLGTRSAHVGPTAEDFHAAFGLGEGPTTITTVDADGIALLGVQTLERRTAELRAENAKLRADLATLRTELTALKDRLPVSQPQP